MNIVETGLILFLENYKQNIHFYTTGLRLPIREQHEDFIFFDLGKSYLLVEEGGVSSNREKSRQENPFVLRIDVDDFEVTLEELHMHGIEVKVIVEDWGTIGIIIDPEGNRIELKKIHRAK